MNSSYPSIPTLETERLIIRPWRMSDAADMFEYASDLLVTRYAMWLPQSSVEETERDIAHAVRRYESDDPSSVEPWMYWGIELKDESKFVGSVGFPDWNRTDNRANFGFALNRKYWGCGIMTEAAIPLLQFGWDKMQLHRIEANCIASNDASISVLTKLGFERESIRKEAARIDKEYLDVIHWRMLSKRTS